jgi:hypothetical protein
LSVEKEIPPNNPGALEGRFVQQVNTFIPFIQVASPRLYGNVGISLFLQTNHSSGIPKNISLYIPNFKMDA